MLLLTAAFGVATAATTMAQVYSVNAVGYVNTTLNKGWNLICNPLQNQTDNTVAGLFGDALPVGATIYKWTGSTYDSAVYFGMWAPADMTLLPGEGAFVFIPADAPAAPTVTFVGEVAQGEASNMKVNAGFALVSSKVPQEGKISTDLKFPVEVGDTIYTWGASGYDSYVYLGFWVDEPTIKVGQGFWSYKGAAADWNRNFDVNNP
ncbi:MAG: hypothetical protein HXY24_12070 [Rubrivivax sp.]|nr:hypothetical protein [Rubrivivax sp.]